MKSIFLMASLSLVLSSHAQEFNNQERVEIEKTVKLLVDAWSEGDGNKFAFPFTEDADFMVWFGLHLTGKQEIATGHDFIFKDFYANTIWNLKVEKIRFVGNDVALVHCAGAVVKLGDPEPDEPDAVPLLVLHKIDCQWKIVALQNTIYAVKEFNGMGSIAEIKKNIREKLDK